jgi:Zn-dependent M16 (insulinase) family peptidase
LHEVRDKALRGKLSLVYAGDPSCLSAEYVAGLKPSAFPGEKRDINTTPPAKRLGLAVPSNGCHVIAGVSLLGRSPDSAALAIATGILRNEYIVPELRFRAGAYGGDVRVSLDESLVYSSYRDVDFEKTLSVFAGCGAFLRHFRLDEETLEGYKLNALADATASGGLLDDAMDALYDELSGRGADFRIRFAEALKNVSVNDVIDVCDFIEETWADASYAVIASSEAISRRSALFDDVIKTSGR